MVGHSQGGKRALWIGVGAVGLGLFVAVTLGVGVYGFEKLKGFRSSVKTTASARAAEQQLLQQSPVMMVAPAPLPTALPLVPRPGNDEYAYPRSYVNGPALRSLLEHDRFVELTAYVEQFQREFEAEPAKELWPIRAVESFGSAQPALLPKLDAWVAASPTSFAPYAARGAHWVEVAYARRGSKWARETPEANFAGMRAAATHAQADLERALALAPKSVATLRLLIHLSIPLSDRARADAAVKAAERVCPTCFSVRAAYLVGLEPRWGGSYREMEDYATRVPVRLNARLKLLPGYADGERSDVARNQKNLGEALRFANAACALGEHWDFLSTRADVLIAQHDTEHALIDLDKAIDQRPELPGLHLLRARAHEEREEWEGAAVDLIDSMRLDATGEWPRYLLPRIVQGLTNEGIAAHERSDRDTAVRLLELASELSPFDPEVHRLREQAILGKVSGTTDELQQLEAKALASPDDFRAHQQLDFALAKQRKYERVIEIWTEYLQRHPQAGPAYFERSGAYYNSGHRAEAFADIGKACDLGVDQACAYQKRLAH
jgi:tetratricopeptide (TPR) repeat protein